MYRDVTRMLGILEAEYPTRVRARCLRARGYWSLFGVTLMFGAIPFDDGETVSREWGIALGVGPWRLVVSVETLRRSVPRGTP